MTPVFNQELSREFTEVVPTLQGYCWYNALTTLRQLILTDKRFDGARYVEGYAVPASSKRPIEHGWIELVDGSVVDVTWPHETRILHFAGVRYRVEELEGVDAKTLPQVWKSYGFGGFDNKDYHQCYMDAAEKSFGGFPILNSVASSKPPKQKKHCY